MKLFFYRLVMAAVLFAIGLFLYGTSQSENETDFIEVVDAVIDAGMDSPVDLNSPGFFERRVILSTSDVNAAFSRNVIAQLLALDADDKTKPIDFYLRTEGGWEADAFAVVDAIRSIQAPVNIHGLGEVHSAGSMILAAGTGTRFVYENTLLGFHSAGPGEEPLFEARYIEFWKKHANLPTHWIENRDEEMFYFTAKEAIEMGVADEMGRGQ